MEIIFEAGAFCLGIKNKKLYTLSSDIKTMSDKYPKKDILNGMYVNPEYRFKLEKVRSKYHPYKIMHYYPISWIDDENESHIIADEFHLYDEDILKNIDFVKDHFINGDEIILELLI